MPVVNHPPASIEGRKLYLKAKNIVPRGRPAFAMIEDQKKVCHVISADENARSSIQQTYNPVQVEGLETIRHKIDQISMLALHDEIQGKKLWGLVENPLPPLRVGGTAGSARHKNQDVELAGEFCYMSIITGWTGYSVLIHPQNHLLR